MSTEAIAYLITISSSSIDSPVTHARLACSLPYTWASMPHNSQIGKNIRPNATIKLSFNIVIINSIIKIKNNLVPFLFI